MPDTIILADVGDVLLVILGITLGLGFIARSMALTEQMSSIPAGTSTASSSPPCPQLPPVPPPLPPAPIEALRGLSPSGFEEFVCDLFSHQGYSVKRTGRAGDLGVDALITHDGITIIVQAKRFAESQRVGAPLLREFWGSREDFGAGAGFFVTTSDFTPAAKKMAEKRHGRLRLIDGKELVVLAERAGILASWCCLQAPIAVEPAAQLGLDLPR